MRHHLSEASGQQPVHLEYQESGDFGVLGGRIWMGAWVLSPQAQQAGVEALASHQFWGPSHNLLGSARKERCTLHPGFKLMLPQDEASIQQAVAEANAFALASHQFWAILQASKSATRFDLLLKVVNMALTLEPKLMLVQVGVSMQQAVAEANAFALASHQFWGMWAILQALRYAPHLFQLMKIVTLALALELELVLLQDAASIQKAIVKANAFALASHQFWRAWAILQTSRSAHTHLSQIGGQWQYALAPELKLMLLQDEGSIQKAVVEANAFAPASTSSGGCGPSCKL